ncbi:nuclear transport factor 2 family protein [Cupriavidus numazuensis]|uniref:DUF4440 domain-containing protein n=1 Tax=Cupriavidus numazuensis TaxID=221992 RepID=A0ABM8TQP3_9BURK|nr:nuclear transport factor 2 family protein [Cupriavidus numazuensis]CAG2158247.1 hypothetical protein LMG26411_05900 [Cupriavidus numazuensis]
MKEQNTDTAEDVVHRQILAADKKRVEAMIAADEAALIDILSDELIYVHSSGRKESRELYISKVLDGTYGYRSIVTTRRQLSFFGDVVIDNGDSDVDIEVGGTLRQIANRFLMVWKREGGNWRLLRFHGSPIAREASDQ